MTPEMLTKARAAAAEMYATSPFAPFVRPTDAIELIVRENGLARRILSKRRTHVAGYRLPPSLTTHRA